ncbi:ComEC/Rec2 family competence protein, partial [Streptomyces scabiei]|uniref:ComEC/Rec2 family competence protein n=1 Tax=Streptomyces scabiei TaxID=1930 RepID=UPI0039EEE9FB
RLDSHLADRMCEADFLWRTTFSDLFMPFAGVPGRSTLPGATLAEDLDLLDKLSDEQFVDAALEFTCALPYSTGGVSALDDPEVRRRALDLAAARGPQQLRFSERLLADPPRIRDWLRQFARDCDEAFFAEAWSRLRHQLAADARHKTDLLRHKGLAEALAAAAAAQAVCAPVVVVLSQRVSLVGVPCNLLAEFAVAPATVLGFAALATAPAAMPLAKSLAWCGSWPAEWIAGIARTGAALPGAGVDWPGGWAGAALLALATVGVLLAGRRLLRHPWWCGVCALLLLLVVTQPPPLARVIKGWPPPGWRMVMCDVGQGDALVLAAGEGTAVVVDAGPDPALADHCLRALGITRVPLVLLTHPHADHVAGLPGVLRGRSVGAIETTALEEPADQAEFVRRQAAARHIPLRHAAAGERRRSGPLSWQVVWPPPSPPTTAPPGTEGGPNDASVTLLVRTAGLRLLLL